MEEREAAAIRSFVWIERGRVKKMKSTVHRVQQCTAESFKPSDVPLEQDFSSPALRRLVRH